MSYKSQKQYRRKEYDYSQDGFYFVTICCKKREIFFGNIVGTRRGAFSQLSEIGKIARRFYLEIPNRFLFVKLDEYIIMPNHIHGIIEIDNENNNDNDNDNDNRRNCRNAPRRVLVNNALNIEKNTPRRVPTGIQPLVKNSLSSIINHFKGNTKKFCNKNNLEHFAWQPRFHDRIIRNNDELNRIRQYIVNNPLKWEIDRNNIENLYM